MIKVRLNLRNVVAGAICLAGVLTANNVLAQDFQHTDASGVKYTFSPTTEYGVDVVRLKTLDVASFPSGLTKWVLPEMVTNGATTYRLVGVASGAWSEGVVVSTNVTEIVFPKYVGTVYPELGSYWFPESSPFKNVHKITFGENIDYIPQCSKLPLDTIIFLGTSIIDAGSYGGLWSHSGLFADCPANTKIIVPCGTLNAYVTAFNNPTTTWSEPFFGGAKVWTAANFVEAECLNTLTVLSNNVSLGNAISQNGSGQTLTTTTPNNTNTTFSGTATLYALAKAGKVFIGWADGNLDNPRTITVSSDTTFTANFADCENTGIEETRSAAAGIQVYPNPANNTLNVQLENYVTTGALTLFDMNGKIVLLQAANGNSAQINLSQLTAGNYILRLVESGAASAGVQVIKN